MYVYKDNTEFYRVAHKECDFSDDLKHIKSSKFDCATVFTKRMILYKFRNNIPHVDTVSELLPCTYLLKTRLDKFYKVVFEVASSVGNQCVGYYRTLGYNMINICYRNKNKNKVFDE